MKSLIIMFSETHVVFTLVFYFAIATYSSFCPLMPPDKHRYFKALMFPAVFVGTLFLTSNSISVFKLIFLAELIYYLGIAALSFIKKSPSIFFIALASLATALVFKLSGLIDAAALLNVRWFGLASIFAFAINYIIYIRDKAALSFQRCHFINQLATIFLIFMFSQDGLFFMLGARLVYFVILFRDLIQVVRNEKQKEENRLALIEQDFEDEVRKQVKARLFHMERSREKMAEIAKIDKLTGVYNKNTILNAIKDKLQDKRCTTFSLLMFDIDKFKQVNDNLGHIAGDKCIVEVARIAQDCVRGGDMVGRYGGDEFFVLLDGADLKTAIVVAERLRKGVEKTKDPSITVSIGISNYPTDASIVKDLIKHADDGLYIAKNKGRNALGYFAQT